MRSFSFAAALIIAATGAPALAQQKQDMAKTTVNGQRIRIDGFYHLNPDCSLVGYPTIRVVSGPSAGRVAIKKEKGFPSFGADTARAKCNARRSPTMAVYYTPQRRFTGSDMFSFEIYWTDGDIWTRNVTVDVR